MSVADLFPIITGLGHAYRAGARCRLCAPIRSPLVLLGEPGSGKKHHPSPSLRSSWARRALLFSWRTHSDLHRNSGAFLGNASIATPRPRQSSNWCDEPCPTSRLQAGYRSKIEHPIHQPRQVTIGTRLLPSAPWLKRLVWDGSLPRPSTRREASLLASDASMR